LNYKAHTNNKGWKNKRNLKEISHLNYLEKENLISARNEFRNRKLLTIYLITDKGLMNWLIEKKLFEF
jgi:ribosomal protein S25